MLVSAILPTRGRRDWATEAVECFLSQTYPNRELVIIDDADDPSFPEPPWFTLDTTRHDDVYDVQYHRQKHRLTVGSKRNLACSRASGEVILHQDSDDWSAPGRMQDQVDRLKATGAGLTGYNSMKFYHVERDEWWRYVGNPSYCIGSSMCYTRDFWKANPFPDLNVGEDNTVTQRAGNVALADANDLMYARTHAGCTDAREGFGEGSCWIKL